MALSKIIENEKDFFEPVIKWVEETTASGVVYTHNGCFHADDTAVVAFLRIFGFEGTVRRVSNVPTEATGSLIFDIGGGKFDHHQSDAERRVFPWEQPIGIKYAAFGLIVRDSGILDLSGFGRWDEFFVSRLDAADNGEGPPTDWGSTIKALNPSYYETDPQIEEAQFELAVGFMKLVIEAEIKKNIDFMTAADDMSWYNYCDEDGSHQGETDAGERFLILDRGVFPWKPFCKGRNKAIAVIAPSNRDLGYYNVLTNTGYVISSTLYINKVDVPNINFIHSSRFIAVTKDLATAITICRHWVVDELDDEPNIKKNFRFDPDESDAEEHCYDDCSQCNHRQYCTEYKLLA